MGAHDAATPITLAHLSLQLPFATAAFVIVLVSCCAVARAYQRWHLQAAQDPSAFYSPEAKETPKSSEFFRTNGYEIHKGVLDATALETLRTLPLSIYNSRPINGEAARRQRPLESDLRAHAPERALVVAEGRDPLGDERHPHEVGGDGGGGGLEDGAGAGADEGVCGGS